jgi:hypothetical protein
MSGRARRTGRTGDTAANPPNGGSSTARLAAPPELIVVTYAEARVRTSGPALTAAASEQADELTSALGEAVLRPLFAPTEERAEAAGRAVPGAPDLSTFYRVEAPPEALEALARDLVETGAVSTAYVKPPTEPATAPGINDMVARPDAPATTPDYSSRQFYLDAAPSGVDARFAWTRTGGKGAGVRVVDVEGAWRFGHEDLIANQGGVVGGTESTDLGWRDHGTAVVGVIGSDENGFGTTGIAPEASVSAVSIFGSGQGSAKAIRDAADRLNPGDILLIELHRPGPRHDFDSRDDQLGYIAVEWWDDDFAAIAYATAKGVIVVEAAGNGAENLDDPLYAIRPAGFPLSWTNPFDRANRDSGALLVGAGAPPPGTHGRNHGPDRSRLGFSNFGASVDVQGVGREVTTTGYGDLQGGNSEDIWYTDQFSGTSSSSPVVVGVLACAQGALLAASRPTLTPATARALLRSTGTAQQNAPGRPATQRIGNRPDLSQILGQLFPKTIGEGKNDVKEGKDLKEKDFKESVKENKEFKENVKDRKEFKEGIKDRKEFKEGIKDRKEFKEGIKDVKEFKENFKEGVKDVKEFTEGKEFDGLEQFETEQFVTRGVTPGSGEADLEARVAGLEAAVAELTHFIVPRLRPDVR